MASKKILAAVAIAAGIAAMATTVAANCVNDPSLCQPDQICEPTTGQCRTCMKVVKLRGGGQNPNSIDLQIQSRFTVANDGCIINSTDSTITVTPGTVLIFDGKAGVGPQPTSVTWEGANIPAESNHIIECPAVPGEVGQLVLDNKDGGGKDVDRIIITVR
jgi:hypothetical protein